MIIRHELPTYQWMTFLFEERFLYHNNSRCGIQVFFWNRKGIGRKIWSIKFEQKFIQPKLQSEKAAVPEKPLHQKKIII